MTQEEFQKQLIDKLNKAADYIANKSRQPQANYIVVSSQVAEAFRKLEIEEEIKRKKKDRKKKLNILKEIFEQNKKTSE